MTKTRLTANLVSAEVASGTNAKRLKSSFGGAVLARIKMLDDGLVADTIDALKVSPLQKGSGLWNWVQPILSSGGHIIGAPVATTSIEEATRMGVRVLTGLLEGKMFKANKPEYALPVLLVLLRAKDDTTNIDRVQAGDLLQACAYSEESPVEDVMATDFKETLLERLKYANIADYLQHQELYEDHNVASVCAPRWRDIKSAVRGVCSNKMARKIRRIMVVKFPKLCSKKRIEALRRFLLSPVATEDSHPVTVFIERCWSMRGSSISISIPKQPPPIVYTILSAYGLKRGEITRDGSSALRAVLLARFEAFEEWAVRLHGGGSTPVAWSDTLSKFASNVNPTIHRYNKVNSVTPLASVTSFVPYDLAPEMYTSYGPTATGYFFWGRGMYYKYSEVWRRDAVRAIILGLLPSSVNALNGVDLDLFRTLITLELAYGGGRPLLGALALASISEEVFTRFLRQYYWSGAFLEVNKKIIRSEI